MEVASNIGAQLGDTVRKEAMPAVEKPVASHGGGGRENAHRQDGAEGGFQALVSELSAPASDDAEEVAPVLGDVSPVPQHSKIRIPIPSSNTGFHAAVSELSMIMSDDAGADTPISDDFTGALQERQIRIPYRSGSAEFNTAVSELSVIMSDDAEADARISDNFTGALQGRQTSITNQSGQAEFNAAVSELSMITSDGSGDDVPVIGVVNTVQRESKHSLSTLGATSNSVGEYLAYGDGGVVVKPQRLGQTAATIPVDAHRSVLPDAKAVQTEKILLTGTPKRQSAPVNELSQLVLPGIEKIEGEGIQLTEKQRRQIATHGDLPRLPVSREGFSNLTTPSTTHISVPVITATIGEIADSELDIEMGMEFSVGKRLVGQQTLINHALSNPATPQAPALSATAQIMAAIKANRRGDAIEVRLDPPEMGRIKIDFTMETHDAVRATLTAERGETLDHLRKNISDLEAQLKQAGFASIEFEFSNNGEKEFATQSNASGMSDQDGGDIIPQRDRNIVYLSLRSNALLDLLA